MAHDMETYNVPLTTNRKNSRDPDDWYELLVEGTIEVCRFRPTFEDIMAASKQHEFTLEKEFAEVVSYIATHGLRVEDSVTPLNEHTCSQSTRELWRYLDQLPFNTYNDQFLIRCFMDSSFKERALYPMSLPDKVLRFLGQRFFWPNMIGIERLLKRHRYILIPNTSLAGADFEEGDVLKIEKKPWEDRFVSFALVTGVAEGHIQRVEFKYCWTTPFTASLEGLNKFFFRDSETKLVGVWRKTLQ